MEQYLPLLQDAVKILVGLGAMYGTVRASLNGAKADISEIKQDVKEIAVVQRQHGEDIAVLKERRSQDRSISTVSTVDRGA